MWATAIVAIDYIDNFVAVVIKVDYINDINQMSGHHLNE